MFDIVLTITDVAMVVMLCYAYSSYNVSDDADDGEES
jgi:hypothetical protein